MPIPPDTLDKDGFHPYGARTRPADHEWRLEERHCLITPQAHARLDVYDSTLPTGTYIGKVWRRGDYLGEFVPDDEPGMIGIRWRKLEVVFPVRDPRGERIFPASQDVNVSALAPFAGYTTKEG